MKNTKINILRNSHFVHDFSTPYPYNLTDLIKQCSWKQNQWILKSIDYLKMEACYMNYMSYSFGFRISQPITQIRIRISKDNYLTIHTEVILYVIFAKPDEARPILIHTYSE